MPYQQVKVFQNPEINNKQSNFWMVDLYLEDSYLTYLKMGLEIEF